MACAGVRSIVHSPIIAVLFALALLRTLRGTDASDGELWSGAGGAWLPNFDCLGNEQADAVLDELSWFGGSVSTLRSTGSARVSGWQGQIKEQEVWDTYVLRVFRYQPEVMLQGDCPFAVEVLHSLQWSACMMARGGGTGPRTMRYVGCFTDDAQRDFCCGPKSFGHDQHSCAAACADFSYFALQMGGQCFCDDSFATPAHVYSRVDDVECGGAHGLGGGWRNSIYALEEHAAASAMNSTVAQLCAEPPSGFLQQLPQRPHGLAPSVALPVFLNTRFALPTCQVLHMLREVALRRAELLDPAAAVRKAADCAQLRGTMDWDAYFEGQVTDADLAPQERAPLGPVELLGAECALGLLSLLLRKLRVAQALRTEEYGSLAGLVARALAQSGGLAVLLLSRWPALQLFCDLAAEAQARGDDGSAGCQWKPYRLDFRPLEVLGPLPRDLRALSRSEHLAALRELAWQGSPTFRGVLAALETALALEPMRHGLKLILVTVLWGERYSSYLPGTLLRWRALGLERSALVFCLDVAVRAACVEAHQHPVLCVEGTVQTVYNKFTILAAVVRAGFDAVFLDFDTLLLRNPVPLILEAARRDRAQLLVGRDFGSECLNVGVLYFEACAATSAFLASLLEWLWYNPYENDQKAFSGLLGVQNITDVGSITVAGPRPRWAVLEPTNHFVTSVVYHRGVEGWTGRIEDIAVYHFLDGAGGADPNQAESGQYVNLFELFYANPSLDLANTNVPLWLQDPRVEQHLRSTWLPGPAAALAPCTLLPDV